MPWQPIETAPKDGTSVLVYVGKMGHDYAVAHWNGDFWDMLPETTEADSYTRMFGRPTHWMPLPKPPVERDACLHPDNMISILCDAVAPHGYGIESITLTWLSPLINAGPIKVTYSSEHHDLSD